MQSMDLRRVLDSHPTAHGSDTTDRCARRFPQQQIDRVSKISPLLFSQGPFPTEWFMSLGSKEAPKVLQQGTWLHSQNFFVLPVTEVIQATGQPSHRKDDEGLHRFVLLPFPGSAKVERDTNPS